MINPIGATAQFASDLAQKIPTLSTEERDQFAKDKLG